MAETEEKTELTFHQKMLKLIKELKAPKNQFNSFGNYNYRSAEDILEGVKKIALDLELLPKLSDEVVVIGDRYYVKATATITDGVDVMQATGLARETDSKKGMDGSQITGTASSYARKYAMNGLYQIDDNKDADTPEFNQQTNDNNATEKQIKLLKSKVEQYCRTKNGEKSMFENFLAEQYRVESIYKANKQTTSNIIDFINSKLN